MVRFTQNPRTTNGTKTNSWGGYISVGTEAGGLKPSDASVSPSDPSWTINYRVPTEQLSGQGPIAGLSAGVRRPNMDCGV